MVLTAPEPKPSLSPGGGRLLLLGSASIFIYFITLFIPYLISLSAFPLIVAMIYYKRSTSLTLILTCSAVVFFLLQAFDSHWVMALFPLYVTVCIIAIAAGETLLRNIPPVSALLGFGVFLVAVVFVFGHVIVYQSRERLVGFLERSLMSIQDQVTSQSLDKGSEFKDYLQLLIDQADEIVVAVPTYIFISIFLGIWLNLYLALRNYRVFLLFKGYPHRLKDLTNIRLPFWLAYLVIGLLFIYIFAPSIGGEYFQSFLLGALYVVGSFLFLQGFGVFLEYFNFFKVRGFLRPLLLFFTVVFANTILAIVGLFDLWFDFRKFFKQKNKDNKKGSLL